MRPLDLTEPNNLRSLFDAVDVVRDLAVGLRADASFLRTLWRTLGPGRMPSPPRPPVFPAATPLPVPALAGKRIAVVASGGSGATAAVVGVRRAFEEAGIEPVMISACSGATLFASLWAMGLSAEDMAAFWLGLDTADYIDPSWHDLARAIPRGMRGWAGLLRGEAIEATYRRHFGSLTLGDTQIPFATVVWNIDHNRVEYLSTRATPDLPVARAARVAISIPIMVQPVRLGHAWYGDGGIVDIFPTAPLAIEEPIDLVIGINSYMPPMFDGEWLPDWHERAGSVIRASAQLRFAVGLELARDHLRQLGSRLELLHPVPYTEVRGASFYQSFLDRQEWPRYMRLGHEHARDALAHRGEAERDVAARLAEGAPRVAERRPELH